MAFRVALLSLVACGIVAGSPAWSAQPATKPVVTNKTRFRIPFRFDPAVLERMNARELRLYVSSDGGVSWELAQTIGVKSGKFEFQAPGDGEYRFAVKTLDARNQLHPPGEIYETGLIVIVDSTPPELNLALREAGPGKVELHWQAHDAHLDIDTLRLDYTQPGVEEWQAVSVVPRATGHTSWSVPQGGIVAVRGTVSDRAGNEGRWEVRTRVEPASNSEGRPRKPDLRQPIAEGPASSPEQSPLTESFIPIIPRQAPLAAQERQPATVVERQPVTFSPPTQLITDQPTLRPEIAQDRWSEINEPLPPPSVESPAKPSTRQRLLRTRKFQIGYQIEDIGPSGLGGVELFVTQDQGRKWWKYGDDPDQQSPFDVEVPGDGEYGFAIRARSGVGLSTDPPAPGEPPAILVVVDQTPPTIELLPVRQGTGSQINKLQLRWKITESHPSDAPVALFYSASPNGPWETITSWRADTGEYVWTVAPGVPPQVYFRIVARDAAGNVSQQQSPRPVIVDLSRPTARIVDIEPPGDHYPQ